MPYRWPADTDFALWELDVLDRDCPACGRRMYICDHRYRHLHTLEGPVELICKLNHCPDPHCPGHTKTKSPETRSHHRPAPLGHRLGRLLLDRPSTVSLATGRSPRSKPNSWTPTRIKLSEDAIGQYIRRYQVMLAARQQDPEALRRQYESVEEIILSIDGLQPEKGHETLYVVRELTQKRVWFAEALISATADEVRRLIAKAKEWAEALGKPVALWMSDRQDAFVTGIAAEFPDVPHRYCDNHFLRDVAKPVLEADSHTKVQMRKKVRGLRKIEQAVLKRQGVDGVGDRRRRRMPQATVTVTVAPADPPASPRPIPPAPWCSTTARRCAASSMTIRVDRSILPACGWPRPWMRSANRSNGTWTRKKGVRGEATRPLGRLHRPRPRRSRGRTRDDPRLRRGHRGGGRDPRSRDRGAARSARRSSRS